MKKSNAIQALLLWLKYLDKHPYQATIFIFLVSLGFCLATIIYAFKYL